MEQPDDYAHRIYEETMTALKRRSAAEDFDIETVKAELDALYTYQGHGMDGRNFYKDAEIEGQIDAYQVFLFRRSEDSKPD